MTFLFLKIVGLMLLAAGFGAWLARWFFRHRYEDVTVQYSGWQNDWAQWRKSLDSKLSLRQMIDLSPVTERLNELETLVRGFGMPKPPPVDLAPVIEAVHGIHVPAAPTYDFTPLYSRMYLVEQHVASIRVPDLAPLHDRLDALEACVQRSVAAIEIPRPIPTDLSPVLERLLAVDRRVEGIRIPELAPVIERVTAVDRRVEAIRIPDLGPVIEQVAAVERQVEAIRIPDLGPVIEQVAAVERRVESIRIPDLAPVMAGLNAVVESNRGDLAPLYDRMAQVDKAVHDIPRPVPVDLVPVFDRLAAVDARVAAIRIPEPPAPADLQPVHAKLDAVERAVTGIRMPTLDLAPVQARLTEVQGSLQRSIEQTVAAIPAPPLPKETDLRPVMARVDAVEAPLMQRLDALDGRIGAIRFDPPPPLDLMPLQLRLSGLEASMASVATATAASKVDFAPLEARLAQLESSLARHVADTVGKLPAPVAPKEPNLVPVIERIAGLETKVQAIKLPPAPPMTNLMPLHDKLDALSRVVGGLKAPPPPPAPAVDLITPMRSSLDKRLDALEHAVAAIRIPVIPAPTPPVDLKPIVDRLQGLEGSLARLESARAEAMSLRRTPSVATVTVDPVRKLAVAEAVVIKPTAKVQAKAAAPASAQLGLGFDARHVREGSRNLLSDAVFGQADDLKEIVGVAAGLERLLHAVGVYYFWQIAEWTPTDVEYVDTKLKAFKGRITRDAWVKQCVKLATKKGAAKKP